MEQVHDYTTEVHDHTTEQEHERYRMSHVEAHYGQLDMPACTNDTACHKLRHYGQLDTPARWTFVSDERHVKVPEDLIADYQAILSRSRV